MSQVARHVQKRERETQHVKHIHKTKLKHRVTVGEKVLYMVFAAAFAIMCIFVVSNQATMYQLQSDIQKVEADIGKQTQMNHNLEEKASELSKPERILQKAAQHGLKIQKNNVQMIP